MANKAVFEGLVYDENDRLLDVSYVGNEACYVVDDNGFKLHISSEQIDKQVLESMKEEIIENKDLISEKTSDMIGSDDIFTHAIINQQLENIDKHLDELFNRGIPESGRAYLGMLGFKIVVNHHGEIVRVDQPSVSIDE